MSEYTLVKDISTTSIDYYNDYAYLFEAFILINKSKVIVEIGVSHGETTVTLCRASKKTEGRVIGVDNWETCGIWNQFTFGPDFNKENVEKFLNLNGCDNYTLYKKNTTDHDYPEFLKKIVNDKIDFAFIDACHSYQGITNDFRAIYPLLSNMGIIAFHDTQCVDGCREFMLDLRTIYYDGSYDIFDLSAGGGDLKLGVSFLIKKQFPVLKNPITSVCGSPNTPENILSREQELYNSEISSHKSSFIWTTTKS